MRGGKLPTKENRSKLAASLGACGGYRTLQRHGREHYVRMSKLGNEAIRNGSKKLRKFVPIEDPLP